MIIAYSFIGRLPNYIVETLIQARLFFEGDIYLILDDLKSPLLEKIKGLIIKLVPYKEVVNNEFLKICKKRGNKIAIVNSLGHRKLLFLRSMERFFLLQNLMEKKDLDNILFLELDNLIYDDPNKWKAKLKEINFTFMYDNKNRISTGLMYIKNLDSIKIITNNLKIYVKEEQGFISEMGGNWLVKDHAYFLPTHWKDDKYNNLSYNNYGDFGKSIFDSLSIGWYFFGPDKIHDYSKKNPWGEIDYTGYKYEWLEDEKGRRRPYFIINNEKILINNLHIHSKNLKAGLSK